METVQKMAKETFEREPIRTYSYAITTMSLYCVECAKPVAIGKKVIVQLKLDVWTGAVICPNCSILYENEVRGKLKIEETDFFKQYKGG